MKKYKWWVEEVPTNATGPAVVGTGDDDSTVVVKKKPKIYKRKRRMSAEKVEESRMAGTGFAVALKDPKGWKIVFKGNKRDQEKEIKKLQKDDKKLGKDFRGYRTQMPMGHVISNSVEEDRNYRKEYDNYHSKPEQREKNAARLRARRLMIKNGKAARGDGKDVHHKDNNPTNNDEKNLTMTDPSWNRREPRLRKEEVEESINIDERKLTDTELKRREEIAKDLNDADFKKRYGDRWKEVKMGVATNMAKKESVKEQDDPKADKAKSKELKVAKAIAQAQLAIAKEQERIQKLTDLQKRIKDQASEETIMNKKYLETKPGTLEEATLGIWQSAAEELDKLNVEGGFANAPKGMKFPTKGVADRSKYPQSLVRKAVKIATKMGGDMTGAWEKIEKIKKGLGDDPEVQAALQAANEQKEESSKVDGRTKAYREAVRRIKMRQERNKVKAKSQPVTEEEVIDEAKKGLRYRGAPAELRARQLTNPDKETMVVKKNYVIVIDKKDEPEYLKKGWKLAEEGSKEEYQKFFNAALKKFGAKSPSDMDDEKKKKFFDYIDKNWKGEGEKKESVVSEKIEYVEYQFRNKNEAMAAKKFFDGQQRMEFDVEDDNISNGELRVDAGKNDMTKYHEAIVKKLKPKVIAKENEKKK